MTQTAIQAERAVIGAMLIKREAADRARLSLKPDDFYDLKNQLAFSAILAAIDSGHDEPDIAIVSEQLRRDGHMADLGSSNYLLNCIDEVSQAEHIQSYARIVKEASLDRAIGDQITRTHEERTPGNVSRLGELIATRQGLQCGKIFDFRENLGEALIELFQAKDPGIRTGFRNLDDLLSGLHPSEGDLMTIGARTSGGKTATMTAFAVNMAAKGVECLFLTTEMTESQMVSRVLPMATRIPAWKFRKRQLNDQEKKDVVDIAKEKLEPLSLKIIGKSRPSVNDIRAAVIQARPKVLFVDYLQRLKLGGGDARHYQIMDAMMELKTLAQELGVQIILGCQLDRGRDKNAAVPPTLSDLKDSGAIEAESDQVLLLWRPPETELAKRPEWLPPPDGSVQVECLIAKNRHGPANVATDFLLNGELVEISEKLVKPTQQELYR